MTVHSWGHAIDIQSANNNINYAISKATQYANERDAAEAKCDKLQGEIHEQNEKYLALGHKYNGLVDKFNNMVTEKNEVIEELEGDVETCKILIKNKNAEIAELKALLEEHGISTEPSGMKP